VEKKNPAPIGDGAEFGMWINAEFGPNCVNNQETDAATPEQAWERFRQAILEQHTNPSPEKALRIRGLRDALVAALNDGSAP